MTDMEAEGISAIYGISGFSPPTSVNLSGLTISMTDLAKKAAYSYSSPLLVPLVASTWNISEQSRVAS